MSLILVLAGLLPVAGTVAPAYAGTIQVTTPNDEFAHPGPGAGCSLREAIQSANQGSNFGGCTGATVGGNTIVLQATTYTLGTQDNGQYGFNGTPAIYTPITIEGNGATIARGGSLPLRLFHVAKAGDFLTALVGPAPSDGNLTLRNVTLSNGLAQGGRGGDGGNDQGSGGGGGGGFGGAIYVRGALVGSPGTELEFAL